MRKLLVVGLICLAATAQAQQRRVISPLAMQGLWVAGVGDPPPQCTDDGYMLGFGMADTSEVALQVSQQVNGEQTKPTTTNYKVVPAPPGAPVQIDIFLKSDRDEIGIQILTGSKMNWIPAGSDGKYSQTLFHMRRCG